MLIRTERLLLRTWRDADIDPFAAMNADPAVMVDMPALDRAGSAEKLARYRRSWDAHGYGRWLIETPGGDFLGYAGLMPIGAGHPLAPGAEIGWRLVRAAWGRGYAVEAARTALADSFARLGLTEVLSYTAPDNSRSQAVMRRLGLARRGELDFVDASGPQGPWSGLVWSAAADSPLIGGSGHHPNE